jgi:hypothetical protein
MFKKIKDFLFGTKSVSTEETAAIAPYKVEPAVVDKPITPPVQEVTATVAVAESKIEVKKEEVAAVITLPAVAESKIEAKKEVSATGAKKAPNKKPNNKQKSSTTKTATTAKKKTTAKSPKNIK